MISGSLGRANNKATQQRPRYDNYVPRLFALVGVAVTAFGAILPWLQGQTAQISVPIIHIGIGAQIVKTEGGLRDGGAYVLAVDAAILLAALSLASQRKRHGGGSRLVLAIGAVLVIGLGVALLLRPQQLYSQNGLLRDLSTLSLVSIRATTGTYLLLAGGALVALGAITPPRRPDPPSAGSHLPRP
jgi:hypothetical protein